MLSPCTLRIKTSPLGKNSVPGFGYQRGFDFKLEDLFGKAAFGYDSVHCSIRLDL